LSASEALKEGGEMFVERDLFREVVRLAADDELLHFPVNGK
jgi:hypothetical protein